MDAMTALVVGPFPCTSPNLRIKCVTISYNNAEVIKPLATYLLIN